VLFGAAGVIDALAAFFPKTVVRLMVLSREASTGSAGAEVLAEARKLQYVVSKAEEFIGKFGVVGIKEAVFRVTGLGTLEGGRLPLKGRLADGEWEKWRAQLLTDIEKTEAEL
jgi:2-keto-3-deoxy-L-rhamnonate aldolase